MDLDENAALRSVAEGTAGDTGEHFFHSLVDHLRTAMGTMGAWVAVLDAERRELRALSMAMREHWLDGFVYSIEGTPCATVVDERRVLHVPERLVELYRGNPNMAAFGAVSYLGVPLFDSNKEIIGHVAVLDDKPMASEPRGMAIFQIFANRAGAELQRLQAERATVEREAQLRLLVDNAMDAIIDFDEQYQVSLMNPAAARAFGSGGDVREPVA